MNRRTPVAERATVHDVARAAGVSIATVSRVVNGSAPVAAERRDAVEAALRKLDFVPNHFARSLISRRSRAIGLIVPTLTNPVFAPTIGGIEKVLDAAGYALLIHSCERDPDKEFAQVCTLLDRGVDGLILTGSMHKPQLAPMLARRRARFVSQDVAEKAAFGPSIALPNRLAMRAAVDHLHAYGHRRIAVLSGPTRHTPPMRDRLAATLARLKEFGIAPPAHWIAETEGYDSQSTRAAAAGLLAAPNGPSAIICTGDILALGLVAECRARALRIPEDMSVVGCGDTDMGHYVDPPLTTIRMPFVELGEAAATQLLAILAGARPKNTLLTLAHEFVGRESVRYCNTTQLPET